MKSYDAIVIGAGPNGLVAAATLAKRGRRVLVLEAADDIGGHTRPIEFAPGFRAPLSEDCGWIPPSVRKSLGVAIEDATSGVSLSVATEDGSLLSLPWSSDARAGSRALETSIQRHSRRDAARWAPFVERLHRFSAILGRLYQLAPPDIDTRSVTDAVSLLGVARRLRGLGRAEMVEFLRVMPMSVQDLLDDELEAEPLKAAVAGTAIRDLRQGPRSGGTTFNLLHYMVGEGGPWLRGRRWFADGPDAFARAVADVLRRQNNGAEIRTAARVARIVVRDHAVQGVALESGEELQAKVVLSTADPKRTFLELVDPVWLDPEFLLAVKNVKLRGCTAFAFYALDRVDDKLVGPVSCTPTTAALEKAADAAKYGEVSRDPHVEFFVPTLRWPRLAPEGKHVVTARVQYAPYRLKDGPWNRDRGCALLEKTTAIIAGVVPGFRETILHQSILTPEDVEQRFGVTEGALTQGELTLDQILFMRPVPGWGRYTTPIDGLHLGGSGAHPGPGILGGAGLLAAQSTF